MSGSPAVLTFPDDASARDLRTYVSRARKADPDGAARLVGHGDVLAAYVSPVHGSGAPTVLGLRTLRLAAPADLDVTVSLAAIGDRLAAEPPGLVLPVPPAEVGASWADARDGVSATAPVMRSPSNSLDLCFLSTRCPPASKRADLVEPADGYCRRWRPCGAPPSRATNLSCLTRCPQVMDFLFPRCFELPNRT